VTWGISSIICLLGLTLRVPDHITLSRRFGMSASLSAVLQGASAKITFRPPL
jgi:hypothetical protein